MSSRNSFKSIQSKEIIKESQETLNHKLLLVKCKSIIKQLKEEILLKKEEVDNLKTKNKDLTNAISLMKNNLGEQYKSIKIEKDNYFSKYETIKENNNILKLENVKLKEDIKNLKIKYKTKKHKLKNNFRESEKKLIYDKNQLRIKELEEKNSIINNENLILKQKEILISKENDKLLKIINNLNKESNNNKNEENNQQNIQLQEELKKIQNMQKKETNKLEKTIKKVKKNMKEDKIIKEIKNLKLQIQDQTKLNKNQEITELITSFKTEIKQLKSNQNTQSKPTIADSDINQIFNNFKLKIMNFK